LIWLWVAITIGFESKEILVISISKERNMLLAERFISSLAKRIHGSQHPSSFHRWRYLVSIHPQACKFLRLPHHIHSPYEKSIIIERTMQYMIKDRTECFDDYFPCRKKNCKLLHVWNWLNLFIGYHNKQLQIVK
jgi:putative transposase